MKDRLEQLRTRYKNASDSFIFAVGINAEDIDQRRRKYEHSSDVYYAAIMLDVVENKPDKYADIVFDYLKKQHGDKTLEIVLEVMEKMAIRFPKSVPGMPDLSLN